MTSNNDHTMTMGLAPDQLEQRLLDKQRELLAENTPATLLGVAACFLFFLYILCGTQDPATVLPWAMFTAAVLLIRYTYHQYFLSHRDDERIQQTWYRVQWLGIAVGGAAWGYAAVAFMPEEPLTLAIIIMMLSGMSAASTAIYASIRCLSAANITPMLTPLSIYMLTLGDELYLTMGIIGLTFMGIMLLTGERMHRAIVHSLRIGLENQEIAAVSTLARRHAEQLYVDLRHETENRKQIALMIEQSEREFRRILSHMQDTYYQTDVNDRLVRVSDSVETLLGYKPAELIGRQLAEFYAQPKDWEQFLVTLKQCQGKVNNYTARFRRRDNSVIWVSTNAHYRLDESGRVLGIEGTTRDITALKAAESALHEEKEKAEVTLSSIGDGVITTDTDGRIAYMNPVAERLAGCALGTAHGRPLSKIISVSIDGRDDIIPALFDTIAANNRECPTLLDGDLLLTNRVNSNKHLVEITASSLMDAAHGRRGTVLVLRDVTSLRGMAREMSYQATHDPLTGLINRAEFERHLQSAIEATRANPQTQHALMYIDLDQFKVVNDTCGHAAGDALLRQLTQELRARVRGNDILSRLGGDEFGVLLTHCHIEHAQRVAEELRDIVKGFSFTWDDKLFEIGASIGLVAITCDGFDLAGLLSAADSACYVAKDLGRNRVYTFDSDDREVSLRHGQMQWIQRIKQALADDRVVLHCQEVRPLHNQESAGVYFEVLMRLVDEDGSLVPPATFIPAAERYNLMPLLDRRVVGKALRHYATSNALAPGDIVAINLSGQSLAEEKFLDFILAEIRGSGLPAEQVCLEITETAAISNLAQALHFMSTLKALGCRFALDDFGSGLSSFAYLKRMPVDFLKIDGEFVREVHRDASQYAMVESINHVGHTLGIRTIAEFVENEDILATLRDIGVDYAQGYGIARPVPVAQCCRRPERLD